MAKVTLNKDGKLRKKGSGKTKGAGCFTRVSWSQLQEYVSESIPIPISRVWLRELGVPEQAKRKGKVKKPKPQAVIENALPAASNEEAVDEETWETSTESMREPELLPEPEPVVVDAKQPEPEIPEEEDEVSEEELSAQVAVTPPYRYAQDFDL